MASSSSNNYLKQGYVPFRGDPAEFHSWATLMRSIMYEQGLGKVMTGIETAPEVRTETSENERAAEQAALAAFEEKNGRLFTRLQLATSDCAQGFMSAAAQVVQSFGPIHPKEFGDGRGAFLALESKYRREGIYRMQQLQSQLTNLAVTADDHFDPARVIQELRRISAELDALGDKVVPARKVHTLLGALPDSKYETFKAALTCEDSPDDSTLDFESIVRRVTKYHSMQIRDKVSQHDGSGTHGRAHNTVVHGGAREFRKQGGRGRGRGRRRGNGGGNASGQESSGGSPSNNSYGGSSAGSAQGARGGGRGNQASGRGRGRGRDNGQNYKGRCRYCHDSTEHGWHDCPLRLRHQAEDAQEQATATHEPATQAWFTRVQEDSNELEDFAIVIGECEQVYQEPAAEQPAERAAAQERVPEAPAARQHHECDAAVDGVQALAAPGTTKRREAAAVHAQVEDAPAQVEYAPDTTQIVAYTSSFRAEQQETPPAIAGTTVFVDSAASSHMVSADSPASQYVVKRSDCNIRIKGSCGMSSANTKGTLQFGIRNDRNQIVPVSLEVLLVRDLGANIFSVGALKEKGVLCDLMSTPPALRSGKHVFPVSTEIPRMYVVNIILDGASLDGSAQVFSTKLDAHLWHRRMGHCNPRALQQLADKDHSGINFNRNIESGECVVCAAGNSRKTSHPAVNRARAQTRLELVHADTWGKHPVASYSGCQSAVMFTDDKSQMRWGVPLKTKDQAVEGLQLLVRDVADPEGLCVGTVHCDGGGEFMGKFLSYCQSLGIKIETNPPHIPQGNAIAERGFGSIFGTTRKLLLGAPHLPDKLWAEAFPTHSCRQSE